MGGWLQITAGLIALVLWGGSLWVAFGLGSDSEQAAQARESKAAQSSAQIAADAAARAISQITVRHQTIRAEVEREIIEKPVYRDPSCHSGARSLQLYNAGLADAEPPPDPGELPASGAGHG